MHALLAFSGCGFVFQMSPEALENLDYVSDGLGKAYKVWLSILLIFLETSLKSLITVYNMYFYCQL